jgi:hypothetical protein
MEIEIISPSKAIEIIDSLVFPRNPALIKRTDETKIRYSPSSDSYLIPDVLQFWFPPQGSFQLLAIAAHEVRHRMQSKVWSSWRGGFFTTLLKRELLKETAILLNYSDLLEYLEKQKIEPFYEIDAMMVEVAVLLCFKIFQRLELEKIKEILLTHPDEIFVLCRSMQEEYKKLRL